jgi:hypothetical protein
MWFPILYKYYTSDCSQTPPTWRFCTLSTSFFPQFVLPTASLKQLAAAGWQNFVRGLKKLLSENLSFSSSSSSSSSSSAGVLRPNKDELAEL